MVLTLIDSAPTLHSVGSISCSTNLLQELRVARNTPISIDIWQQSLTMSFIKFPWVWLPHNVLKLNCHQVGFYILNFLRKHGYWVKLLPVFWKGGVESPHWCWSQYSWWTVRTWRHLPVGWVLRIPFFWWQGISLPSSPCNGRISDVDDWLVSLLEVMTLKFRESNLSYQFM